MKRRLGWADWMGEQAQSGRTVWAYFNNDTGAHAIADALTLKAMVRQTAAPAPSLRVDAR